MRNGKYFYIIPPCPNENFFPSLCAQGYLPKVSGEVPRLNFYKNLSIHNLHAHRVIQLSDCASFQSVVPKYAWPCMGQYILLLIITIFGEYLGMQSVRPTYSLPWTCSLMIDGTQFRISSSLCYTYYLI